MPKPMPSTFPMPMTRGWKVERIPATDGRFERVFVTAPNGLVFPCSDPEFQELCERSPRSIPRAVFRKAKDRSRPDDCNVPLLSPVSRIAQGIPSPRGPLDLWCVDADSLEYVGGDLLAVLPADALPNQWRDKPDPAPGEWTVGQTADGAFVGFPDDLPSGYRMIGRVINSYRNGLLEQPWGPDAEPAEALTAASTN